MGSVRLNLISSKTERIKYLFKIRGGGGMGFVFMGWNNPAICHLYIININYDQGMKMENSGARSLS